MKSRLTIICVLLILYILPISSAKAFSETFTVPAEDGMLRTVNLNEGDEVSGRITVVGTRENSINFSISDPNNITILSYQNIGLRDFKFTASNTGVYNFYFENWFSQEAKHVTFNYNVRHYIFGFPQEIILVFVIVGLALVAIVVFVAMSPRP